MALFIAGLVVLIGIVNILFPDKFLLFGLYTSAGMPIFAQVVWTMGAVLALCLARKSFRISNLSLIMVALVMIASFFLFRVKYSCMFEDGELGGQPVDMHLLPLSSLDKSFLSKNFFLIFYRLPTVMSFLLCRMMPDWITFDYQLPILFRNLELDNAWILTTLLFGVMTVTIVTFAILRLKLDPRHKLALQIFALCSAPVLNAYGFFDSYIFEVFFTVWLFSCLWGLSTNPSLWRHWISLALLVPLAICTHEYLYFIPLYASVLFFFMFLQKKGKRIPFMLAIVLGIALTSVPLLSRVLSFAIFSKVYSYHPAFFLTTQFMACIMVSLPALILAIITMIKDPDIFKSPTPIQAVSLTILSANILIFFFPILETCPPAMIHNYGVYGAMIYGASLILFLSSRASKEVIVYCAILSFYVFIPMVYVHSNRLIYERLMKIVPQDITCRWSREMSPYVNLGLISPIDTEQDRQSRLDLFKTGATNTIPEWQEFRPLNYIYYIAWCFEFGKTEEGTQSLLQAFNQPGMLMDLWSNGTRFTNRYDNKAYRRIRDLSRRIIDDNLRREPSNEYLKRLSSILDEYEQKNP